MAKTTKLHVTIEDKYPNSKYIKIHRKIPLNRSQTKAYKNSQKKITEIKFIYLEAAQGHDNKLRTLMPSSIDTFVSINPGSPI